MVYQSSKRTFDAIWSENKMSNVKDETGKKYGSYIVIRIIYPNYPNNCTVRWECECTHCGAKKIYIGNGLRFGHYAHTCRECGRS